MSAVKNSFGVVTGVSSVDVTVTLAGGARVEKVRPNDFVLTSLDEVPGGQEERNRLEELMLIHVPTSRKQTDVHAAPDPPPHYTSLAEGTQAQQHAKSIKELLVLWHGKASLQPTWARSFWAEVGRREPLEPKVRTLLLSHGYLGKGAGSPSRVKELKEKLEELSIAGALAPHHERLPRPRRGSVAGRSRFGHLGCCAPTKSEKSWTRNLHLDEISWRTLRTGLDQ